MLLSEPSESHDLLSVEGMKHCEKYQNETDTEQANVAATTASTDLLTTAATDFHLCKKTQTCSLSFLICQMTVEGSTFRGAKKVE